MTDEQKYLIAITEPLVEGLVTVTRITDDRGVLLTLHIEKPEEIGKIIGKGGETARAIRRLIRQYGMAHEMHIAMKIDEPERK